MKYKKTLRIKITAWLVLLATIVALFPVVSVKPDEAQAKATVTDFKLVDIKLTRGDYTLGSNANKDLIITGNYYSNPNAVTSYHTTYIYFHTQDSYGNPTSSAAGKTFPVYVGDHESVPSTTKPGYVQDTYYVDHDTLKSMIITLFGPDKLTGEQTVYFSEGFQVKTRKDAKSFWKIHGKTYNTLEDIRDAADWSGTTWENFYMYYDAQITLNLDDLFKGAKKKYKLEVEEEGNGIVSGSIGEFEAGTPVYEIASPDNGWYLKEWKGNKVGIEGVDWDEETIRFHMPARDVKLIAVFEPVDGSKPEPTKKPVEVTLAPEADGGGPSPSPIPTVTPAPTPQPAVDLKRDVDFHRYYTTDKGYSIDKLADSPVLYNRYGSNAYSSLFREKVNYQVGTDTEGNEWYFYANGNAATYVHPKTYKGYDVRSASIKYIEELTFPEKLTAGNTTYTVISIGGGLSWYGKTTRPAPAGADYSWDQNMYAGVYDYYLLKSNSDSLYAYDYEDLSYWFGVLGNGNMGSSSGVYIEYRLTGAERSQLYDSSYTVYNTTLKMITIPKSVTRIENYAFANCNALEKIEGGDGIRIIGENAFEGGSVGLMLSGGDGNNGSKNYISYNDSYALSLPYTPVMLEYDKTRQLSDYMQLAEFPRLETIRENAFLNRKNLFDVKLPAGVVTIEANAFDGCRLNSIELPGMTTKIEGDRRTLGTKGYTTENVKTQIITKPESTAMYYGLTYIYYYKVRCGYEITYDNNFTPEETYTTTAEMAEEYIREEVSVYAVGDGSGFDLEDECLAKITLDVDGNVWFRRPGNILPHKIEFPAKVAALVSESGTNYIRDTYSMPPYGQEVTFQIEKGSAYVYLENGQVYRYRSQTYNSADKETPYKATFVDTGVPAGAHHHEIVKETSVYYQSTTGYQSGSSAVGESSQVYLYYITKEGALERIRQSGCGKSESSSSGGGSSYSTFAPATCSPVFGAAPEKVPLPSGVKLESISIPDSQRTGFTNSHNGSGEGTYFVPILYARSTDDEYFVSSGTFFTSWNTAEERAERFTYGIQNIVWTKQTTGPFVIQAWSGSDGTPLMKSIFQNSYDGQSVFAFYGISSEGDLLRISHKTTYDAKKYSYSRQTTVATMEEGSYSFMTPYNGQTFLVDEGGYYYFFVGHKEFVPQKMFNDADIVFLETVVAQPMYGTNPKITLIDSNNRLWRISYMHKTRTEDNRNINRIESISCKVDYTFPDKPKKISYHAGLGLGLAQLACQDISMLILLENGELHGYGLNYLGNTESASVGGNYYMIGFLSAADYSQYGSGMYIMKGKVPLPDNVQIADISHMRTYSLLLDIDGNVYRTGCYLGEGNYVSPDYYHGFTLVPDLEMEYSESGSFFSGYHFVERLYDNMFLRDGYTFLNWNLMEDNSDAPLFPDEELVVEGPTRIYANWEKTVNKVRYHPNGGSGHMEDSVCDPLVTRKVVLSECLFTMDGHGFVGWNTKKDGTGTMYRPGTEYNTGTRTSTTLYAQWQPLDYTLHVAENEVRVRPVTSTSHELSYNEEFTIPAAKPDRSFTVDYRLNKRSTMSTTPAWKTPTPFSDNYTKAKLKFIGWELWEEIAKNTEYNYLNRLYLPGQIDKNFARHKQYDPFLFPYWGGEDAYVDLPVAVCDGYWFVGYTTTATETNEENVIHAEDGSGAMYKPKGNETLYAYYEPKQYEIDLVVDVEDAEPGEITETQTEVLMTFDKVLPTVEIPQSDIYIFMGYYDKLDADGHPITEGSGKSTQYYDEYGNPCLDASGNPLVWRIHDESVTKLYAYFISEIEVTLDGRGATKQEQKSVIMTYDQVGPDVIPPEKTGYTFQGYYTGIRGAGKRYFDENGKGCAVWLEKRTNILYAYWIQNPVELPEKDPTVDPEVLPEERVVIEASLDASTVQIYADDNDPTTGAVTDVQPYLVSDVVIDGKVVAEGAIPSTENVAIRAKMGAWLLSSVLERRSGVDYVRVYVTVPYQTRYEDEETEELIISDILYATYNFMIPKAWSYWVVADGGIYFPEKVVVENEALEGGKEDLIVVWNLEEAAKRPAYRISSYGEKPEHVIWDLETGEGKEFDTDGTPCVSVNLSNVETIVSVVPGELPDVSLHLQNVCQNAAWKENSQFSVKSDGIEVDGVKLLEDVISENGTGAMPNLQEIERLTERIDETAYQQTYKSGVSLQKEVQNGCYKTKAAVEYVASGKNVGNRKKKTVSVSKVNEIKIHTPVLCEPEITADNETMYQCESIPEKSTVLVLDVEGMYSDFLLRIENTGYHSDKKGYGEKDYSAYLAQRNGEVQNEVCFPFSVWLDTENDGKTENDIWIPKGEWYLLGDKEQRFYVPIDTKEGLYELNFRSVAVNGAGREENTEEYCNSEVTAYVATGSRTVFLTGRLYDFTVYRVQGTTAWNEVEESDMTYTVGTQKESGDVRKTLPLRQGGHPRYRNLGGLPMGGEISFRMKSIGSSFGKGSTVTIVPYLTLRTEDEVEIADVYYEEETEQGVFLRKWEEEEQKRTITITEDTESAVREWQNSFRLPDYLYIAKKGTDVFGIQKREGLSFKESFWIKKEPLVLCFAITLENPQGETLYYGMIPKKIKNNIWKTEAKASYREDSLGNRFEILGGEVAVIYSGDSVDKESAIYGIY